MYEQVKILQIMCPEYEISSLQKDLNPSEQQTIAKLENVARKISNREESFSLEEICSSVTNSYTKDFLEELTKGPYDPSAIREYLGWYLRLTLTYLKGASSLSKEKVQQLYQKVVDQSYIIENRKSVGHSPSYFLIDAEKPFAILKESTPEFFSSFKKYLPNLPLSASTWEHELIGYEQDQLFGFNYTPTTLAVTFQNENQQIVRGTIQEFIPFAKPGGGFYRPQDADLLKAIPKCHVHALALSGFFKGLSAGHMSNYLLQIHEKNEEKFVRAIFEIDLEEMLMPYNRLTEVEDLVVSEHIALNKEELVTSLVLCRLWILGFPQCEKPFDRACLMIMAHPALLSLLEHYHKSASTHFQMDQASWQAQYKRVKLMHEICCNELKKESIHLTPRDLYFTLFGGEHVWKIAQEKKYPPLLAFNNLLGDPYFFKDYKNLQSIPVSTFLEESPGKPPLLLELMHFFRKMADPTI